MSEGVFIMRESRSDPEGGADFLAAISLPQGVCGELGGGGEIYFFGAENVHQGIYFLSWLGRKHPSRDVIFSGQKM